MNAQQVNKICLIDWIELRQIYELNEARATFVKQFFNGIINFKILDYYAFQFILTKHEK